MKSSRIEFRADVPWGNFRASGIGKFLLFFANITPVKAVAFLLRRPIKYKAQRPFDVYRWGFKMRLLPRGNYTDQELLFTPLFFEVAERKWLREFFPKGGTFLDIGANSATFSFWVLRQIGEDCVLHAIEPDPMMSSCIEFTKRENGLQQPRVHKCALSDSSGSVTLFITQDNRGQNSLTSTGNAQESALEVPSFTLLDFMDAQNISKADFIKIDVEGNELRVLKPFFEAAPVERRPDFVLAEIAHMENNANRFDWLLQEFGYRLVRKSRMNGLYQRK